MAEKLTPFLLVVFGGMQAEQARLRLENECARTCRSVRRGHCHEQSPGGRNQPQPLHGGQSVTTIRQPCSSTGRPGGVPGALVIHVGHAVAIGIPQWTGRNLAQEDRSADLPERVQRAGAVGFLPP